MVQCGVHDKNLCQFRHMFLQMRNHKFGSHAHSAQGFELASVGLAHIY
jgi:hypothetical protein